MKTYAPIALFTYARADHTKDAVESLLHNQEAAFSDLYVFSDGPKTSSKVSAVMENRRFIHTIQGFKSVHIVEHEKNQGLANSLIAGITKVVNEYGRVIVVEDDLVLSPYFLQYMNAALDKYEHDDRVSAITGYCPVLDDTLPDTFFLHYFHCWGWATWKRGWDLMNLDTKDLLRKMRFKTHKFNLDDAVGNYGMLYCQKVGLVDSWFIRLYASFFLAGKLTLFPGHSLVSNHGLDGSGTHCVDTGGQDNMSEVLCQGPVKLSDVPVEEDERAYQIISTLLKQQLPKENTLKRSFRRFKSFIRRLLFIDCA